jgi:hypothetical protein
MQLVRVDDILNGAIRLTVGKADAEPVGTFAACAGRRRRFYDGKLKETAVTFAGR